MVVNDGIFFFIIIAACCDLFWNIAFVQFNSKMSPLCDFALEHRLHVISF
jgi:hypothetical protein